MIDNINWYPGHMKKNRELIRDHLSLVDAAVEVLDARVPNASRNPILGELLAEKPRIVVLNKRDLAEEGVTDAWRQYIRRQGDRAVSADCRQGSGLKGLWQTLQELEQEKYPEGGPHKAFRLMVVGVPNVGKSSLINRLTGKKSTQVGDRPGVTRGKQWLTLSNGMQLLDTPGILWPKFEDPEVGLSLAFCGSIKDEVVDRGDLGLALIERLSDMAPEALCKRYKLEALKETPLATMEAIAAKRGFLLSGGRVDYERTAATLLDEFRSGKMGRISLERPEMAKQEK